MAPDDSRRGFSGRMMNFEYASTVKDVADNILILQLKIVMRIMKERNQHERLKE